MNLVKLLYVGERSLQHQSGEHVSTPKSCSGRNGSRSSLQQKDGASLGSASVSSPHSVPSTAHAVTAAVPHGSLKKGRPVDPAVPSHLTEHGQRGGRDRKKQGDSYSAHSGGQGTAIQDVASQVLCSICVCV